MTDSIEFFPCDCGTEAISVQVIEDVPGVFLNLWKQAPIGAFGWRVKLRWIWDILTRGDFQADQVVMTDEVARKLGVHLIDIANFPSARATTTGSSGGFTFYATSPDDSRSV